MAVDVQILTLSCRDRAGITAQVTGYLFDKGGNIIEAQQFNDVEDGEFFMRVAFDPGPADPEAIRAGFAPLAAEYGMRWTLRSSAKPRKVLLLVSKFDHCLVALAHHGLEPGDVLAELLRREGTSGIEEKALRKVLARERAGDDVL